MDVITYDEQPKMIIDDRSQSEHSQEFMQIPSVLGLEQIETYLNKNTTIYIQKVINEDFGDLLLVCPVNTDTILVDVSPVRLNITVQEDGIFVELLSLSREQLCSSIITSLQDLDVYVENLIHNKYCKGFPEELLSSQFDTLDLKNIFIHPYNGKVFIRSRNCKFVCSTTESKPKKSSPNICQSCQELGALHEVDQLKEDSNWSISDQDEAIIHPSLDEEIRFEIIEEEPHQNSQLQHQEDIKPQIDTEDTNILSNNAAIEKQLRNNHLKRSKQKQNFSKKKRLSYHCETCFQEFFYLKDLQKHIKINQDGCCKENADLQKAKPQGRQRSVVGQHSCHICGKRYKKKAVLNIHMQSHSNVKAFLCVDCGAGFKAQSGLINHRKRVHLGVKHHKCPECDREFYARKEFDDHCRTHSGDKPFQCPLCGKCFNRNAHLKRHTDSVHLNKKKLKLSKGNNQDEEMKTTVIEVIQSNKKLLRKKVSQTAPDYKTLKALLMKPSDLTNKDYKPELTITADTNNDDNVLLMGKSAVIFPSADEISVSNQDFVIRRVAKNPDIILSHESVDSSIEKVNRAPMVVNPDLTLKSQISGNHALTTSQTIDFRKDIIGRTSVGNPNVIFKPLSSTGNPNIIYKPITPTNRVIVTSQDGTADIAPYLAVNPTRTSKLQVVEDDDETGFVLKDISHQHFYDSRQSTEMDED